MNSLINHRDHFLIRFVSIFLKALANTKFPFKFIDFLAVLLLIFDIALSTARNLPLLLFVLFLHLLDVFLELEVFLVPLHLLQLLRLLILLLVEALRDVISSLSLSTFAIKG